MPASSASLRRTLEPPSCAGPRTMRRWVRDVARDVRLLSRRLVCDRYLLPSFVIVGARKAATTALFDWIAQHPKMRAPLWKEPRYFDRNYHHGWAWYRANFPIRRPGEDLVTGEATTTYLADPGVPARMASALPEARLVAILRNPVDRALSDWAHEVRRGHETRSAAEALSVRDEPSGYVTCGLYARHLRRFLEHFPREQLLVLRSDALQADPANAYHRTLEHVGLPPYDGATLTPRNVGRYGREASFDRDALVRFYRPHNEALSELLGMDFTDWSRT